MYKKFTRVVAALGSVAFIALAPAQAQARSVPVSNGHGAFYLEVEYSDGTVHDALLRCPSGEGHPHGDRACAQLTSVEGEVAALPPLDGMCTMDYRPVTVRAHGMWQGRFHSYQGEFGNHCVAVGHTGGLLFDIAPA
ncbi:subtilase-type protease inhibitor [Glycomyces tarimensis]